MGFSNGAGDKAKVYLPMQPLLPHFVEWVSGNIVANDLQCFIAGRGGGERGRGGEEEVAGGGSWLLGIKSRMTLSLCHRGSVVAAGHSLLLAVWSLTTP